MRKAVFGALLLLLLLGCVSIAEGSTGPGRWWWCGQERVGVSVDAVANPTSPSCSARNSCTAARRNFSRSWAALCSVSSASPLVLRSRAAVPQARCSSRPWRKRSASASPTSA